MLIRVKYPVTIQSTDNDNIKIVRFLYYCSFVGQQLFLFISIVDLKVYNNFDMKSKIVILHLQLTTCFCSY